MVLHVTYPLFSLSFNKTEYSRQILKKYSVTKFHENPSSWSQVIPCGRTDMTKLMVAFRNFANAHKSDFAADSLTVHASNSENHHHRQHHIKYFMVTVIGFQNTIFFHGFSPTL
jgi:hypothetical protein